MSAKSKAQTNPFTMVRRSIWDSRRFESLPDDLHRYLYLYCLTCQHQTQTGCFKAKPAYILDDLNKRGGDWTADTLRNRIAALVSAGLILADDSTGEILVLDWWKDNGPSNESWFIGARRRCEAISSQILREAALLALEACQEAFQLSRGLFPRRTTSQPSAGLMLEERRRVFD